LRRLFSTTIIARKSMDLTHFTVMHHPWCHEEAEPD
jgi:hypothetical protein